MNITSKQRRVAQLAERSEYTSERLCGSNPTPLILVLSSGPSERNLRGRALLKSKDAGGGFETGPILPQR